MRSVLVFVFIIELNTYRLMPPKEVKEVAPVAPKPSKAKAKAAEKKQAKSAKQVKAAEKGKSFDSKDTAGRDIIRRVPISGLPLTLSHLIFSRSKG